MWPHLPLLQIFTQVRSYTYVLQYYGHVGCVDIKFIIYIESRKIRRTQGKLFWQNRFCKFAFNKFNNNPLTYVGCIASYGYSVTSLYVRSTHVDINLFASFNNCFFELIVIYSVGNAGKFNVIVMIVLLVFRYLNFQTFDLFLQLTIRSLLNN